MWNIYVALCRLSWSVKNCVQPGKYSRILYFYNFNSGLCYCFFMFWRWECSWLGWGSWLISMCAAWTLCCRTWQQMKENNQTSHSLQNQDCSGPWCILARYIYCFKQPWLLFLCFCIPTCKIFSKGTHFMFRGGEKKVKTKSWRVVKIKYFSPVNCPKSFIIKEAKETGPLVQPSNPFLWVQNESYEDS